MNIKWQRLLFWQRKQNRIYTLCPEIRKHVDKAAGVSIVRFMSMALFIPVFLPMIGIWIVCEKIASFISEIEMWRMFFSLDKRRRDLIKQAHEIIPPHEIRRRLKNGS